MHNEKQFEQAAWDAKAQYELEVAMKNERLLKSLGMSLDAFKEVLTDCEPGEMRIAEDFNADDYEDERTEFDTFEEVYIDQWKSGMSEDSFEGQIFVRVNEDTVLEIPFSFN